MRIYYFSYIGCGMIIRLMSVKQVYQRWVIKITFVKSIISDV